MLDCFYARRLRFLSVTQTSMILIQVCLYQKVHMMAMMVTYGQRVLEGPRPLVSWHSSGWDRERECSGLNHKVILCLISHHNHLGVGLCSSHYGQGNRRHGDYITWSWTPGKVELRARPTSIQITKVLEATEQKDIFKQAPFAAASVRALALTAPSGLTLLPQPAESFQPCF